MSKITIIKVNQKNGTMVIPLAVRKKLNISHSVKLSIENDKIVLAPLVDDIETFFTNSTPFNRFISDKEIQSTLNNTRIESKITKYKKSEL